VAWTLLVRSPSAQPAAATRSWFHHARRGLTVHGRDCLTVARACWTRRLTTSNGRGDAGAGAPKRPVRIPSTSATTVPACFRITGAIGSKNGNITKADGDVTDDRRGSTTSVVEVSDLNQLQDIMTASRCARRDQRRARPRPLAERRYGPTCFVARRITPCGVGGLRLQSRDSRASML